MKTDAGTARAFIPLRKFDHVEPKMLSPGLRDSRRNTKMDNQKDTSAQGAMRFLTELASATTRYYEARPDGSEQARIEYELALTRFKGSLAEKVEPPAR